jgi:hypothetical protein
LAHAIPSAVATAAIAEIKSARAVTTNEDICKTPRFENSPATCSRRLPFQSTHGRRGQGISEITAKKK